MPKAARERIRNRGVAEVNPGTGTTSVPSMVRTNINPHGGGSYVSSTGGGMASALAMLSGSFREMARQYEKAEDRAYAEAKQAEDRAYRESERLRLKAEAEEERKLAAFQTNKASMDFLDFKRDVDQRVASGEITSSEEAIGIMRQRLEGLGDEDAHYVSAFSQFAPNYMNQVSTALAGKLEGQTNDRMLGSLYNAQHAMSNDPGSLSVEEFHKQTMDMLHANTTDRFNKLAVENLMTDNFINMYSSLAVSDPEKAGLLYDRLKPWLTSIESGEAKRRLDSAFQAGVATVRAGLEKQEQKAEADAQKSQKASYEGVYMHIMGITDEDALRGMLGKLEGEQESYVSVMGANLYNRLRAETRAYLEELGKRDTEEYRQKLWASERVMQEYEVAAFYGKYPSFDEIANNSDLMRIHKVQLQQKIENQRRMVEETFAGEIDEAVNATHLSLQANRSWIGWSNSDGSLNTATDELLRAGLRRAAYEAARAIPAEGAESDAQRMHAVRQALNAEKDSFLKEGFQRLNQQDPTRVNAGVESPRPRLSEEVDFAAYPQQRADLEAALFSQPSARAVVGHTPGGNHISIKFNREVYDALPATGRDEADAMILLRGNEEYIREVEAYRNSNILWRGIATMFSNDPGEPTVDWDDLKKFESDEFKRAGNLRKPYDLDLAHPENK